MQKSCFFLFLLFAFNSLAQNGRYEISARNAAMAGASATIADEFSGFHNVGALGQYSGGATLVGGYQNRFGIRELNLIGFGALIPTEAGNLAIMANRFGTSDLYNEQRLGVGFSNQIGFVSLGASINYIQYSIETAGSRNLISIDFGGLVEVTPELMFAAYIHNMNQARIQEFTDERLPTLLVAGFSYRPSEELMINAEFEKDVDEEEVIKLGLEYKPVDQVYVRTGIKVKPFEGTFGAGFRPKRFLFDYAYITTPDIGDKHEVSIGYRLTKG